MNKNCAKPKFTEYKFLELFIITMAKQKHFPIIDKKVLEEILYKYYDKPEYKKLFEDVARVNQLDNKRVDLEEAFMTARSFNLLNSINDSTTGRFINNISTDEEKEEILANHDEDKKATMEKLVEEVYPEYIMELDYKQSKGIMKKEQTEQTAFGLTFEEFSKRYDENNGFDVRYPGDSLSTKTTNKKLVKKMDNISPTNSQCESKD